MLKKLLRAGAWVFVGILLGRIAGFVRESFIAGQFGASEQADYAVLILTIPDLLINMLVGGAMGAALIPEFKRLNGKQGWQFFVQSNLLIGALFTLIAFFLTFNSDWIVRLFAPGLGGEGIAEASPLMSVVLWSVPITALTAVFTAYLQANQRFAWPALGTLLFNSVLILGLTLPLGENKLLTLAYAVIVAAMFRWMTQMVQAVRLRERRDEPFVWLVGKPIMIRYLQALATGGLLFLLPVIARMMGSYGEEGALAIINYTSKFVELPLAAFLTVFAVVLFPQLSEAFAKEETQEQGAVLAKQGIGLILLLSVCMTVVLVWFSRDFSELMFGWGKMTHDSIEQIGILASVGLLALPAQGMTSLTQAVFNAKRDTKSPFYLTVGAVVIYAALAYVLYKSMGLMGLIIGMVVVHWALFVAQVIVLRIKHSLNFMDVLISRDAFLIVIVSLIAFSPIAYVSSLIEGHLWIQLGLAFVGGGISLLASVLISKTYRNYLRNVIVRRRG